MFNKEPIIFTSNQKATSVENIAKLSSTQRREERFYRERLMEDILLKLGNDKRLKNAYGFLGVNDGNYAFYLFNNEKAADAQYDSLPDKDVTPFPLLVDPNAIFMY